MIGDVREKLVEARKGSNVIISKELAQEALSLIYDINVKILDEDVEIIK